MQFSPLLTKSKLSFQDLDCASDIMPLKIMIKMVVDVQSCLNSLLLFDYIYILQSVFAKSKMYQCK